MIITSLFHSKAFSSSGGIAAYAVFNDVDSYDSSYRWHHFSLKASHYSAQTVRFLSYGMNISVKQAWVQRHALEFGWLFLYGYSAVRTASQISVNFKPSQRSQALSVLNSLTDALTGYRANVNRTAGRGRSFKRTACTLT